MLIYMAKLLEILNIKLNKITLICYNIAVLE